MKTLIRSAMFLAVAVAVAVVLFSMGKQIVRYAGMLEVKANTAARIRGAEPTQCDTARTKWVCSKLEDYGCGLSWVQAAESNNPGERFKIVVFFCNDNPICSVPGITGDLCNYQPPP